MSTANDLMTAIASFLGRDRSVFVKNGFDCLLRAINNARLYAERQIDFELSVVSVDVPNVSLTNGGSLDNAVLHSDGVTAVNVKKIRKCFVTFASTTATYPIAFYTRSKWNARVQRRFERLTPLDISCFLPNGVSWTNQAMMGAMNQFAVIQMARQVYIAPADPNALGGQTISLYFDVNKWLPQYGQTALTGLSTTTTANKLVASAGSFITNGVHIGMVVTNTTSGASAIITAIDSATSLSLNSNIFTSGNAYSILLASETDFLLDYCFDWLMYRSIFELNFFLKEDERVQLSQTLITDAWNAMRCWNENLISQNTDDVDLD